MECLFPMKRQAARLVRHRVSSFRHTCLRESQISFVTMREREQSRKKQRFVSSKHVPQKTDRSETCSVRLFFSGSRSLIGS